jgi:hypothetical protein
VRPQCAGQRGERGAPAERGEPEQQHVLPQRHRRLVVGAHRAQRASERARREDPTADRNFQGADAPPGANLALGPPGRAAWGSRAVKGCGGRGRAASGWSSGRERQGGRARASVRSGTEAWRGSGRGRAPAVEPSRQ